MSSAESVMSESVRLAAGASGATCSGTPSCVATSSANVERALSTGPAIRCVAPDNCRGELVAHDRAPAASPRLRLHELDGGLFAVMLAPTSALCKRDAKTSTTACAITVGRLDSSTSGTSRQPDPSVILYTYKAMY